MALSHDILSQFAKLVTKDNTKNAESTIYGTIIVDSDGNKYVKLDGSDQLTPLSNDERPVADSTTANANEGERVSVLIKNHTATVTGNISSPAARTEDVENLGDQLSKVQEFDILIGERVEANEAYIKKLQTDKADIGELNAAVAKIEELEATKASIYELTAAKAEITDLIATKIDAEIIEATYAKIEDLEAVNADIDQLKADNVEITNKLTAAEAEIDNLEVNKLSVKDAEMQYATIENLNATNAKVGTLESDVADIDTLIFGSASGSTIQTSFANAVIAQLGNAQIKSAMIESLSASKITAGDIITNNVRVMSEDGSLLISDETIQISDDTRVRVQIGKDAANDYSINIWDADGNLMFSEGGITDSAIKDAIIRNDMVASDANIAASKLDISSLFTEINNSTETINANKVLIDTEAGTLDVAFTQMETDISGLSDDVSSQGTALSIVQGQISSKIWQEDIKTATEGLATEESVTELSTQFSALDQDVDSISATVASHTTQIAEKADSSEVVAVNDKVTKVEADLEGFKTTVSETYVTEGELAEVDDKFGNYSTTEEMQSAIAQSAEEISLTVSSKYATKEEISGIEVGARNLIRNSTTLIFTDYYFYEVVLTVTDDGNGNITLHSDNITVTNNGEGEIAMDIFGVTATDDENGNVTISK